MPNPIPPLPLATYLLGDTWSPQFTFTVGGTLTDPISFALRVELPDASFYTLTYGTDSALARTSLGVFVALIPLTQVSRQAVRQPNGIAISAASDWKIRWAVVLPTSAGNELRVGERLAACKPSQLVNAWP
jgi:hypothetical protein